MGRKKKNKVIDMSKINSDTRLAVITDLLQKYPKGPKGKLEYKNYSNTSYRTDPFTNSENDNRYSDNLEKTVCGYNVVELYKLFVQPSGKMMTALEMLYLHDKEIEFKQRAMTRRSNRLDARVFEAARIVRRVGVGGIYGVRVRYGYNMPSIKVWATNHDDAKTQGAMMFGPAAAAMGYEGSNPNDWESRFQGPASPLQICAANKESLENIENRCKEVQQRIEKNKKTMEDLKQIADFIQIYSTNCIGANS